MVTRNEQGLGSTRADQTLEPGGATAQQIDAQLSSVSHVADQITGHTAPSGIAHATRETFRVLIQRLRRSLGILANQVAPLAAKVANVVKGPTSSTDNAIARWDGVIGRKIQDSSSTISDSGALVAKSLKAQNTVTSVSVQDSPGSDVEFFLQNVGGFFRIGTNTSLDSDAAIVIESGVAPDVRFNGLVGIGTPSTGVDDKLHLENSTANSDVLAKFENDARAWTIGVEGSDSDKFILRDVTAAADRLVIDSSGDVGIGGSPSVLLHLTGGNFRIERTDTSTAAFRVLNTAGSWQFQVPSGGDLQIRDVTNTKTVATFEAATGHIGIGVVPEEQLDVDGAIAIVDGMTAPSTHTGKASIYVDSADGDLKVKFGDGTVKTIVTD